MHHTAPGIGSRERQRPSTSLLLSPLSSTQSCVTHTVLLTRQQRHSLTLLKVLLPCALSEAPAPCSWWLGLQHTGQAAGTEAGSHLQSLRAGIPAPGLHERRPAGMALESSSSSIVLSLFSSLPLQVYLFTGLQGKVPMQKGSET